MPPGTAGVPEVRLFDVKGVGREYDTEVKILETLATILRGKKGEVFKDVKGTLTLASDLKVCAWSSDMISQFKVMFPNIKLIIGTGTKSSYSDN